MTEVFAHGLMPPCIDPSVIYVKELKEFQKVRLRPGETRRISFDLPTTALGFHNSQMRYVVEPGTFHIWVGGDSQSGLQSEVELLP